MKQIIATDRGPKAIGPYSQAVKANGFLFVSGQICLDPHTQQLIEGDVAKQTERVMENLKGIVEAAGSSLGLVGPDVARQRPLGGDEDCAEVLQGGVAVVPEVGFGECDPYGSALRSADATPLAYAELRLLVHLDLGDQPAGPRP